MGKFFDAIQPAHREFMAQQHLFFVATAPLEASGHVNLSPKWLDSFR
jgi:predicted pyridoxine 5'-phosphate oxidase superfamily flavin-nucleotide-binding protein